MKKTPLLLNLFQLAISALSTTLAGVLCVIFAPLTMHPHTCPWIGRIIWCPPILWVFRMKVHLHHEVELDLKKSYLLAFNHQSLLDIPVIFQKTKLFLLWIAKKELMQVPFLGWAMFAAGTLFVDRKNRSQAMKSLSRGKKFIQKGMSVMSFPEGTRSMDGNLLPIKKGAIILAIENQIPIVPCIVLGTRDILPSKSFRSYDSKEIDYWTGTPISTKGMTLENREELTKIFTTAFYALHEKAKKVREERKNHYA